MPELLVVMFKGCGEPCDDVMKQLSQPAMRKFLKESLGIDRVRELDGETDDLAAKILVSTGDYTIPTLAIIKDGSPKKVCVLRHDPISIERCVEFKENFPK